MSALPTKAPVAPTMNLSWMAAIPDALQAYSAYSSGRSNARLLQLQARTAMAQGLADEYTQRRQNRLELGRQAAAMAQAGGGYGGTTALVMRDSHLAGEMDALNYRYRASQQASGLLTEARTVKRESTLLAGAQLLQAGGKWYERQKQREREGV